MSLTFDTLYKLLHEKNNVHLFSTYTKNIMDDIVNMLKHISKKNYLCILNTLVFTPLEDYRPKYLFNNMFWKRIKFNTKSSFMFYKVGPNYEYYISYILELKNGDYILIKIKHDGFWEFESNEWSQLSVHSNFEKLIKSSFDLEDIKSLGMFIKNPDLLESGTLIFELFKTRHRYLV